MKEALPMPGFFIAQLYISKVQWTNYIHQTIKLIDIKLAWTVIVSFSASNFTMSHSGTLMYVLGPWLWRAIWVILQILTRLLRQSVTAPDWMKILSIFVIFDEMFLINRLDIDLFSLHMKNQWKCIAFLYKLKLLILVKICTIIWETSWRTES